MKIFKATLTMLTVIFPIMTFAASFECEKAKSKMEKIICSDAEVSRLDEKLNISYNNTYNRLNKNLNIRKSQREWLASVSLECSDIKCLKTEFSERIAMLNEVSQIGDSTAGWTGNFVRILLGVSDKDTAEISILGLTHQRLFISGSAIWFGPNGDNGQVNAGEIKGYSNLNTLNNTTTFDIDNCQGKISLTGDVLEVRDSVGCGGMNVTFDGQYKRK